MKETYKEVIEKKTCPFCKKQFGELLEVTDTKSERHVKAENGRFIKTMGTQESEEKYWLCPECMEILFYHEEDALNALMGKRVIIYE